MDFLEIAKTRSSVRKYQSNKVESEKINKIIEAAHYAPTAGNLQPVRLIVAQDEESLAKLSKAANIFHAPLAIVVCADHSKAWRRGYDGKISTDIDATILTDHMMLEATELGLGSVWICHFKPEVIKAEFNLRADLEPINILVIGYSVEFVPDTNRHLTKRIAISELLDYQKV